MTGGLRAWLKMGRIHRAPINPKISDEQLIADLQRVSRLNGDHYVSVRYYKEHGRYTSTTYTLRFGNWPSALKKANLIDYEDSLIGQKFGLLTVIRRTDDKDPQGYHLWECQCECGRYRYTDQTSLKRGIAKTCGNAIHQGQVMRDPKTHDKYLMGAYRRLTDEESGLRYPDFDKKPLKSNTSGYVGVYKRGNTWRAELLVKGVKYRAYGFDSPKDAYYNGRLKLEEKYLPENFRKGLKARRKNDLVSLKEYANLHDIPLDDVRTATNNGKLVTAIRLGKNWFVDRNDKIKNIGQIISDSSLIDRVSRTYADTKSLNKTAKAHSISVQKVRKLLITSGGYASPLIDKINAMYKQGLTVDEIASELGKSPKVISGYLPYEKAIYNSDQSTNAKKIKNSRNKKSHSPD